MGCGTPLIDEQSWLIGKSVIDELLLLLLRNANDECRKNLSLLADEPVTQPADWSAPLSLLPSGDQAQ